MFHCVISWRAVTDASGDGIAHQPLAVHVKAVGGGKMGLAMSSEDKSEAVAGVLRACLEGHGGSFDPSHISRRHVWLASGEKSPWQVLDDLLERGELRGSISSHSEF